MNPEGDILQPTAGRFRASLDCMDMVEVSGEVVPGTLAHHPTEPVIYPSVRKFS